MNLAAWVERAGKAHSTRPALAMGTGVVSDYGALSARVARLAAALRRTLHLEAGDRVALVMKNCPEYIEILFALWHAGLAAVPVNAKLHPEELNYILNHCGARLCFATSDLAEIVSEANAATVGEIIVTDSQRYHELFDTDPMAIEIVAPDALAWLFYTSGTTGQPKGAMLSHRNLVAMTLNYFADMDTVTPEDCILHAAPLSHGSGLYMLPHVAAAACNITPASGGFDPFEIFTLIEHWPGLTMFAAPTMVRRLTVHPKETDTRNLKTIAYGGAPMYVEDSIAALDRFGDKLVQLYGQGESPMTITHLSRAMHADRAHPRWRERLGSAGVAQSVVQVRVAGADGNALPVGEPGEVICRGDTVMTGYWNNPAATAEAIRDGWLFTGDVGYFDEDGFLTLTSRSKDVIISGGSNVYPREVEEVLLRAPGVAEVSVIGNRDREWGEVVVAFIVVDTAFETIPSVETLDAHCIEAIARFKRPKHYRFVSELPKNSYGKVLKTVLRESFASDPSAE